MIVVGIEEARAAAVDRLVRDGVPQDQAETAARICLEAELWGRRTHGFIHLRRNLIQHHALDDESSLPGRSARAAASVGKGVCQSQETRNLKPGRACDA